MFETFKSELDLAAIIPPLRQSWPLPARPLPIVLIGAGGIAQNAHLPAYREAGLLVTGLFDVVPEVGAKVAAEHGVGRVFASLESAAAEPGVVFDVAVPAGAVLGVLQALPPGSSVLIQKPLGRDLDEARRIAACCESRKLTAAVNFQLRFSPNMLALADALERSLLGIVRDVEVRVNVLTPWHLWDFLKGIPRHEILYHSIHYLDLIRSLFGEPQGVFCRVTRNPELPDHSDTASVVLLDYGPERRVLVSTNHAHDFGGRHAMSALKVEGTRGVAVAKLGVNLDYPRGEPDELELALAPGNPFQRVPLSGCWFHQAFAGPMSNLQRFVAGADLTLHTRVSDALRTMALVEACYLSSASPGTPLPAVP
jgi:predicted dehydrogenase